uniref:Uncharacterized protein n=1 Tax=Anguilla anguilla TaxID=7936 RepID=A0A0E9VVD4_ANGAN
MSFLLTFLHPVFVLDFFVLCHWDHSAGRFFFSSLIYAFN